LRVCKHTLTFTKLATYSASVVRSSFGNFGRINPVIPDWHAPGSVATTVAKLSVVAGHGVQDVDQNDGDFYGLDEKVVTSWVGAPLQIAAVHGFYARVVVKMLGMFWTP